MMSVTAMQIILSVVKQSDIWIPGKEPTLELLHYSCILYSIQLVLIELLVAHKMFLKLTTGRCHDIQNDETQHNDTQHNDTRC
jgi:hypothetical protein